MSGDSQLQDAESVLLEHEQMMERAITEQMGRGGSGMRVRGGYPVFVYSGEPDEAEDVEGTPALFQLQMFLTDSGLRFSRGKVKAGSFLVVPTIGGIPVDNDPSPVLPRVDGGAQVFARYKYTLDGTVVPYDWADQFVECELVQFNPGVAPEPTMLFIGTTQGVDTGEGEAYELLMAYDAAGSIIYYGQSLLLPPDPDDLSPTDFVLFVSPQVRHVD